MPASFSISFCHLNTVREQCSGAFRKTHFGFSSIGREAMIRENRKGKHASGKDLVCTRKYYSHPSSLLIFIALLSCMFHGRRYEGRKNGWDGHLFYLRKPLFPLLFFFFSFPSSADRIARGSFSIQKGHQVKETWSSNPSKMNSCCVHCTQPNR